MKQALAITMMANVSLGPDSPDRVTAALHFLYCTFVAQQGDGTNVTSQVSSTRHVTRRRGPKYFEPSHYQGTE
ncbi:uncharacterized protein BO66DRAFT_201197 [Aspergillus aculeatinus CBS 121060]|uniref:Uncharacterized protein n=1 Tax=Aspergillus aculeatinus CBS 121060 TaxID=1448322 RepID=A0ACD1HJP1_9EURO|nr:hypothetical protein BO66DRAFT_201197 [Aspergillus aculeatinus CBS 121060]RAH73617.1 hypothetical protein BO66DRAFT_201197 [Aspergillus aculeatinus CBS 121060]